MSTSVEDMAAPPADQPAGTNGIPLGDRITRLVQQARDNGQQIPGRRAIAAQLGVSEHAVRKELEAGARTPSPDPTPDLTHPSPTPVPGAPAGEVGGTRADTARLPGRWPLILIGLAAAVAVWGGWVDLGQMTGFGLVHPLPGLPGWAGDLQINTAIVLPIGIEAYGAYALRVWLSSAALSAATRRYARRSAWASLGVGAGAQIASHLMRASGVVVAPWQVTVVVACVPVAVLGLAVGLATLVRRDTHPGEGGR